MHELLEIFPFVAESKNKFEHYNKLLNKVTLTGKINSDSSTENLFLFADDTNNNFKEIKDNLTQLLLNQNITTLTNELHLKADIIIDILIRNLFERTADIGFLATDTSIIEFLNSSEDANLKHNLALRLDEYVLKYSVYNEVILFDTKGEVKLNFNQENKITATTDPIIQETLKSDSYIERVSFTDIFASQKRTLTYTQKIVDNGVNIGVLCLCFKFEDELQTLFNEFKKENETILLVENNTIIASSNPVRYKLDTHFKISNEKYKIINKSLFVSAKTRGYQGYTGLPWNSVVIRDTNSIATTQVQLLKHSFINQEVQDIIDQADNVVEDLADIIINGELIAAKKRMYLLNPILDNLRFISNNLLLTIKESGTSLESLVQYALKFNLLSASKLAIDIMDRNLYERANDSRWWALTPIFIQELEKDSVDRAKLNKTLSYINGLYTVYTNLFIYDKNATIVASSNEPSIIGTKINSPIVSNVLSNKNTQNYFVSEFESTPYYNNEASYIYHASIHNKKENLGGIGVVFDAKIEFKALLEESKIREFPSISLFIDDKGVVLSCSDESIKPLSPFPFSQSDLTNICQNKTHFDVVTLYDKQYLLTSAISKGYREYKTKDNYRNSVIAVNLVELENIY